MMKAMVINKVSQFAENNSPLELVTLPKPAPQGNELLLKISACGVCHTELDEIEGRTPPPKFPVIPGHQVVGRVEEISGNSGKFKIGDRVGVAWIYSACGTCKFCLSGEENLCADFKATGRDVDGGYAQYMKVPEKYAAKIPDVFSDLEAAPLLCAGTIGFRSLRLTGVRNGQTLGLTGFGASAHLVLKLARQTLPDSKIIVFARSKEEQEFALELGAAWAGDTEETPPEQLDCIIDTTPAWKPVVAALSHLAPGGRLVINAIRKEPADRSELAGLDYERHLWMEKEIKSVANVARIDVQEFLQLAAEIPINPEYQEYDLKDANIALMELKKQKIRGAKVLKI